MQTADSNRVTVPERQCFRHDGEPKKGYATFDEAFALVMGAIGHGSKRVHVYLCPICGLYHVGRNPKAPK
jgi:hypothetical protein